MVSARVSFRGLPIRRCYDKLVVHCSQLDITSGLNCSRLWTLAGRVLLLHHCMPYVFIGALHRVTHTPGSAGVGSTGVRH